MINRIILQGNITKDIELKTLPTGTEVVNFCICWNERYKDNEKTLFLNCVCYGASAKFLDNYFHKGSQIIVEGKLIQRTYNDKDGNKKYITECLVDQLHFCGSKKEQSTNEQDNFNQEYNFADDDLPF